MAKTQTAGNSSKPWWLLGIIIILISVLSSVAVYFMLDSKHAANAGTVVEAEPVEPTPPLFVAVSPFTVNLQSDDRYEHRLLYVGLSFKVGDEQTQQLIEQSMPQLRSRLLMLLSSKNAETLTTPQGKQALSAEILSLFDEPLVDPQPELAVEEVLYTDFIVQ